MRERLIADRGTKRHSIDKRDLWGRGLDPGDPVHAGISVSQDTAQRLSTVYRCISLLSGTNGALPTDIVRAQGPLRLPITARLPAWLEYPNPETTYFEFKERVYESLYADGNAFVLITSRDALGYPRELWNLHPREVTIRRDEGGPIYFVWGGNQRLSRYSYTNPMGDVLHIRLRSMGGLRGLSPIDYARQAIGLGLAGEKFGARFFGKGQQLSGVIQLPESAKSKEYIDLMRETWEANHAGTDQSHRPGILTGGATWQRIAVTPEEAQFLETRKFQVEDIATRIYGIPPHLVGLTEKQTSWGTGVEQQGIGFVRYTLLPDITRWETAMSQLLPRGQFVRENTRALLRADSQTETEVLTKQLMYGVISWNEWRAFLDLEPREGGERYMVPGSQTVLEADGLPKGPEPVPPALRDFVPGEEPAPNGNGVPVGGE